MSVDAGVVDARGTKGHDRADHVCWVYADPGDYRARAIAFLREGLRAGQRLQYVGSGSVESLRRDLEDDAALGETLDRGDLAVRSVDEWYGDVRATDPTDQVDAYADATRAALAEGYSGLRVAADATALVRTRAQREAFARYEHLVDRYMVDAPFAALCGYHEAEIGSPAATEMASLHPRVGPGATSFRWCAARHADVSLSGEVDVACRDAFDVTVARTLPLLEGPRVVVDARRVAFIDHHAMLVLERRAQEHDRRVTLRTDASVVHRLVDLLDLRAVEVA